jgi:hypothetical protein
MSEKINVVEPVRLLDISHYAGLPTCGVAQDGNLANICPTAHDPVRKTKSACIVRVLAYAKMVGKEEA